MVWDAALAPHSGLILIADYLTGQVLLWDQTAWAQAALWQDREYPTSVAVSSSGGALASGYRSAGPAEQAIIAIWDRHTRERTQAILGSTDIYDLAFSPDGTQLAAVDGGVSLYNPSTGMRLGQLDFDPTFRPATAIAFSPDGALLAAGHYDGSVTTWDAKSYLQLADQQALVGNVSADCPMNAIAFSPDGKLIAAGSPEANEIAFLAPLAPGSPTVLNAGHPVYSLAFSPDGNMLAAGGESQVTVWDGHNLTLLCRLVTEATSLVGLAFTSDGASVLSASMEGTLSEWVLGDACVPAGG